MSDIKKIEATSIESEEVASELSSEEKKIIGRWVGKKILESQEKIEKTLEELCEICKKEK